LTEHGLTSRSWTIAASVIFCPRKFAPMRQRRSNSAVPLVLIQDSTVMILR
jgi:hypothetical protein